MDQFYDFMYKVICIRNFVWSYLRMLFTSFSVIDKMANKIIVSLTFRNLLEIGMQTHNFPNLTYLYS